MIKQNQGRKGLHAIHLPKVRISVFTALRL